MDGPPLADAGTVSGVRDALAWWPQTPKCAVAGEREMAAWLLSRHAKLDGIIRAGLEFHRKAALWALKGSAEAPPAAGAVFLASGFPAPGEPPGCGPLHARASMVFPGARVVYVDADARVAEVNADAYAAEPRVSVMRERAMDPAAVLGEDPVTPARLLLERGPVSVHAVLSPARWPPDLAPGVLAGYARLMPAGSTFCISLVVPDEDTRGGQLTEDASKAAGPAYSYTPRDVREWIEGAGMRLHPEGVRPARAWGKASWADPYRVAPAVPGRPVTAVGIVP